MANDEINELLALPDKGVSKTKGVAGILARLFRQTLCDIGITPHRFHMLLLESSSLNKLKYKDPATGSSGKTSKFFAAGNLRRELVKPEMTWKVFVKGIRLLQPIKVDFSIAMTFKNGQVKISQTTIDMGRKDIEDDIWNQDFS